MDPMMMIQQLMAQQNQGQVGIDPRIAAIKKMTRAPNGPPGFTPDFTPGEPIPSQQRNLEQFRLDSGGNDPATDGEVEDVYGEGIQPMGNIPGGGMRPTYGAPEQDQSLQTTEEDLQDVYDQMDQDAGSGFGMQGKQGAPDSYDTQPQPEGRKPYKLPGTGVKTTEEELEDVHNQMDRDAAGPDNALAQAQSDLVNAIEDAEDEDERGTMIDEFVEKWGEDNLPPEAQYFTGRVPRR